jgi:DNA-binding NtrC family response regulator
MATETNEKQPTILIAEDDNTSRAVLAGILRNQSYNVLEATDGREAISLLDDSVDLVSLDLNMPGVSGFDCLLFIQREFSDTPVIVVSGTGIDNGLVAMKQGAYWFLKKPVNAEDLVGVVRSALDQRNAMRAGGGSSGRRQALIEPIVFSSDSLTSRRLADRALSLAGLNSSVLIVGEVGTGKSAVARYLHQHSPRAAKPFFTINCQSVEPELLEIELFGQLADASSDHKGPEGKLAMSHGGTIFLNDLSEIPPETQRKLSYLLESRSFRKLGSTLDESSDVRLIFASTLPFETLLSEGRVVSELVPHLKPAIFPIPSLRDRKEDLMRFITLFLDKICKRRESQPISLVPEALAALSRYDWPGNFRELENMLEHASAFCKDNIIQLADLLTDDPHQLLPSSRDEMLLGGLPLEEIERQAILETLRLVKGNKTAAARKLGISERSIYNKIKRFGLSDADYK